ncbi:MAG: DNA repair protein RecN [Treponema sp.]|nr:DNA repair protein RecN [Treponema sp.]
MLEDLTIKDFAIIDCVTIEFDKGFTVLSGETGAGKSILIGAISFLLGGKAELSQIRNGSHEASVSGTFWLKDNPQALEWLDEHGIESENERIILRRYLRDSGKSASWIGNTPVTRADLSDFSSFLIDIHGQHEHQSLLKVQEHRKFLDSRAGIVSEVSEFTKLYTELVEKRKLLNKLNSSDAERARKIDMLNFAVKEIDDAKLKEGEDISLEEEEARLSSYEKLFAGVREINEYLSSSEGGIVSLLKKARKESSQVSSLDKSLSTLDSRLESAFYELSDISDEFSSYENSLVFDPNHLQEVQDRLSVIYNLKKKYASSQSAPLSEVFDFYQNAIKELEELGGGQENKEHLLKELSELEKKVYLSAKSISEKRKACGKQLATEIEVILKKLGMPNTRFAVSILEKAGSDIEQKCGPYGMDNVEFLISANLGSALLPLSKIASGGELSRVMLALKTIFAENDTVGTLVFDEIDTGIGGEIAVALGSHMKNLASRKQIFCITHLASIAVYADNQIKIEKDVVNGRTASNVHLVSGEERVAEIARMLSGDAYSSESLEHARSMLQKFSGGF